MSTTQTAEFETRAILEDGLDGLGDRDDGPYTVHGIVLGNNDYTQGKYGLKKWVPEELERAASSLEGQEFALYHEDEAIASGTVTRAAYQDDVGVVYEAEIDEYGVAKKLLLGQFEISVEARDATGVDYEDETGAAIMRGYKFTRLSAVEKGASPSNHTMSGPAADNPAIAALSASNAADILDAKDEGEEIRVRIVHVDDDERAAAEDAEDADDRQTTVEVDDDDAEETLADYGDVRVGSAVSWSTQGDRRGYGIVVDKTEEGTFDDRINGDTTVEGPAALIRVYRPISGDGGGATDSSPWSPGTDDNGNPEMVGHKTDSIAVEDSLPDGSSPTADEAEASKSSNEAADLSDVDSEEVEAALSALDDYEEIVRGAVSLDDRGALEIDAVEMTYGVGGVPVDASAEHEGSPWNDFLDAVLEAGGVPFQVGQGAETVLGVYPEDDIRDHDPHFHVAGLEAEEVQALLEEHDAIQLDDVADETADEVGSASNEGRPEAEIVGSPSASDADTGPESTTEQILGVGADEDPLLDPFRSSLEAGVSSVLAKADVDTTPPVTAQRNAEKVLRWRDEHSDEIDGMTDTGWRLASQLASGESLSPDVVGRMAQFAQNQSNSGVASENSGKPWSDAGHVAWLGWGGDVGVSWASRKVDELNRAAESHFGKVSNNYAAAEESDSEPEVLFVPTSPASAESGRPSAEDAPDGPDDVARTNIEGEPPESETETLEAEDDASEGAPKSDPASIQTALGRVVDTDEDYLWYEWDKQEAEAFLEDGDFAVPTPDDEAYAGFSEYVQTDADEYEDFRMGWQGQQNQPSDDSEPGTEDGPSRPILLRFGILGDGESGEEGGDTEVQAVLFQTDAESTDRTDLSAAASEAEDPTVNGPRGVAWNLKRESVRDDRTGILNHSKGVADTAYLLDDIEFAALADDGDDSTVVDFGAIYRPEGSPDTRDSSVSGLESTALSEDDDGSSSDSEERDSETTNGETTDTMSNSDKEDEESSNEQESTVDQTAESGGDVSEGAEGEESEQAAAENSGEESEGQNGETQSAAELGSIDDLDGKVVLGADRHRELREAESRVSSLEDENTRLKSEVQESQAEIGEVRDTYVALLAEHGPYGKDFYDGMKLTRLKSALSDAHGLSLDASGEAQQQNPDGQNAAAEESDGQDQGQAAEAGAESEGEQSDASAALESGLRNGGQNGSNVVPETGGEGHNASDTKASLEQKNDMALGVLAGEDRTAVMNSDRTASAHLETKYGIDVNEHDDEYTLRAALYDARSEGKGSGLKGGI